MELYFSVFLALYFTCCSDEQRYGMVTMQLPVRNYFCSHFTEVVTAVSKLIFPKSVVFKAPEMAFFNPSFWVGLNQRCLFQSITF